MLLALPDWSPEKPSMLTNAGFWDICSVPTLLKPWNPEIDSIYCKHSEETRKGNSHFS